MWSYFVFVNGMSLILLPFLDSLEVGKFLMRYLVELLIIFSFPHFMLTYFVWFKRVENWRQEWWPIAFPFLYALIFFMIYSYHPLGWDISWVVKLSYCYLLYHFAQQLFGSNHWLNLSRKIMIPIWEKKIFQGLCLLSALYALGMMEMSGATTALFYHSAQSWRFPPVMISTIFYTCVTFFLLLLGQRLKRGYEEKRVEELYPLLGYLVCFVWFFPPFMYEVVFFLPLLHALQYMPFIYLKLKKAKIIYLVSVMGLSVVAGYFFFRWLPFHQWGEIVPVSIWAPFILTSLNNHHFVIDGRIWKLRDPKNQDLAIEENQLDKINQ